MAHPARHARHTIAAYQDGEQQGDRRAFKLPETVRIGKKHYSARRDPRVPQSALGDMDATLRESRISTRKLASAAIADTSGHEVVRGFLRDVRSPLRSQKRFRCEIRRLPAEVFRRLPM